MGSARKETPFERRLKELEKEAESVRHNIRSLAKSVDKLGSLAGVAAAIPPARREPIRTELTPPAETVPVQSAPMESSPSRGWPSWSDGAEAAAGPERKKPQVQGDERFASYFSSGSFGKARPLSQERRLQRNKAIMMLLFVMIVAFILYRVIF